MLQGGHIEVRREAKTERHSGGVPEAVMVGMKSKDARIEPLEAPQPLTLCRRVILQPSHEGDGSVGRALVGPGAVAQRLREPVAELEAALVAERDRVPTARFEDHQLVGRTAAHQMASSARAALLLDRADDGEAAAGAGGLPSNRRDGRRQRDFRIDHAASAQKVSVSVYS